MAPIISEIAIPSGAGTEASESRKKLLEQIQIRMDKTKELASKWENSDVRLNHRPSQIYELNSFDDYVRNINIEILKCNSFFITITGFGFRSIHYKYS